MKLTIIVAMSENRVIGRDGGLPWHLSEDLKRFRRLTTGHAIIMGRRTYESIGRVLPQRRNIILTRQPDYRVDGAAVFSSLDEALAHLADEEEVFIIGGGELYRQALPRTDRIELTLIHDHIEGDTWFPELPADTFTETARESHDSPLPHSFITLERRSR